MYQTASLDRGVARIMEEYRHKLFRRWIWAAKCPQRFQDRVLVKGFRARNP
jgi:hypothetical protein